MKRAFLIITLLIYIIGCSEDKSSDAEIIDLNVSSLSNENLTIKSIELNSETKHIYLFIDSDLNNIEFPLTAYADFELSSGATIPSVSKGEIQFSSPDEVKNIDIKAEDGTINSWYMFLIHRQVQNSNFETWFDNKGMNGLYYKEIGSSYETSFWSTANLGTSIYGKYGTQPLIEGTEQYVKIMTDSTITLPLTAATLFTGKFNLAGATSNPTDPKKAIIFGIPFKFKPTAMKFKYKYQAGKRYIQATVNNPSDIFGGFTVNEIEGEDRCSIYAILEARNGDEVNEIARAELYSETTQDVLTETILSFNYTSNEEPTHITIVFASSKDGDLWKGAVGSTLIIDDLELLYE